jgi:osmoprotectant transport system permease protein
VIAVADTFQFGTFADAIRFIGDNGQLMWSATVDHIKLSAEAMAVALVVAVPLGVWLGHVHRGSFVAINLSNIGRALPSIAIIAFGLSLFGPTERNVVAALFILAIPPMLTNAYVGVDGVDDDVVEAARGMGLTAWQILTRVELPLAVPLIFAGIRTATVFVVATATLGAISGAGGGLGDIIVNQASYGLAGVVAAAMLVTLLAFAADGIVAGFQWVATPKALRHRGRARDVGLTASEATGVREVAPTDAAA